MINEQEREIAAADMLCDLATKMEYVGIRMAKMLEHLADADQRAAELRGGAAVVRQWSDLLSEKNHPQPGAGLVRSDASMPTPDEIHRRGGHNPRLRGYSSAQRR